MEAIAVPVGCAQDTADPAIATPAAEEPFMDAQHDDRKMAASAEVARGTSVEAIAVLGEIFERFVEKSPISVMVRGMLERVLGAEQLDEWYARTAEKQYTRTLLFSTVYDLLSSVVFCFKPSVHAA